MQRYNKFTTVNDEFHHKIDLIIDEHIDDNIKKEYRNVFIASYVNVLTWQAGIFLISLTIIIIITYIP